MAKNAINQYNEVIRRYRNHLDKLKLISVSPIESLEENVKLFLEVYIDFFAIEKNNELYVAYVDKFNKLYTNNKDECQNYLSTVTSKLKERIFEKLEEIYRRKDSICQEYIDIDKLDDLFTEQNNERNRNEELQNIVEKLMDEAALLIYEIINRWNYIIDQKKQGNINYKIGYKDKNLNYLNKAKSILEKKEKYRDRLLFVEDTCIDIESTMVRLQEIVCEIDLLLYCINQYILKNSSQFIPIQSFYILRRDDGNEIESDEILSFKYKEGPLNSYFGFENSKSLAAFVKSKQSADAIARIKDFSGYTLVDYKCTRGCNTIIKLGENCYSRYVEKQINEILKKVSNQKIEITDERQ